MFKFEKITSKHLLITIFWRLSEGASYIKKALADQIMYITRATLTGNRQENATMEKLEEENKE